MWLRLSAGRFHYELSEIDWNRIIANGTNSVNKLFSSFYNKYNTIVDKHAPMKKLSNRKAKQLSKPWITNGIRAATKFKINYMQLETKLGRNTIEIKFVH